MTTILMHGHPADWLHVFYSQQQWSVEYSQNDLRQGDGYTWKLMCEHTSSHQQAVSDREVLKTRKRDELSLVVFPI